MSVQDGQALRDSSQVLASEQSTRSVPDDKSNRRRRIRRPVSCEACRRHKLRCDRQIPCGSCKRRSSTLSCTYVRKDNESRQALPSPVSNRHSDLGGTDPLPPAESNLEVSAENEDVLAQSHSDYTSSQWDALLERPVEPMGESISHGTLAQFNTQFPFQMGPTQSMGELFAALPPSHCCDYLITQYFVRLSPIFHVLHGPTFQNQYQDFLQNPQDTDLAWLALLFAMCSVAVHTLEDDDSVLAEIRSKQHQPQTQERAEISYQLRIAAMVCLSQDNFMVNHRLCTLEALLILIYTISNYEGVERGWALLGLTSNIGIALRCNVDVDSTTNNRIDVERRRRCWAGILMLHTYQAITYQDIDMTFLLKIPATMPADVNDTDIQEYTLLQASTKPTQMSVSMFKLELFRLSNRVCRQLSGQMDRTMLSTLDAEIAREQQQWDYTFLLNGSPSLLDTFSYAHWCILQLYAHQLYLLLHRPSCLRRHEADFLPASRSKCLTSGAALIDLHRQFLILPRLRHYRWYVYGLTGSCAVHGAVALASCLLDGADEVVDSAHYRAIFNDAVQRIESLQDRGNIYRKAYPVLRHLQVILSSDRYQSSHPGQNFEVSFDNWIDTVPWFDPDSMDWTFWDNILGGTF